MRRLIHAAADLAALPLSLGVLVWLALHWSNEP